MSALQRLNPVLNPVTLSDRFVRDLPPAKKGQYVVRDKELSGFFVVVGRSAKTYTVQADIYELGREALMTNNKLLASAILTVVNRMDRRDRPFSPAEFASAVVGDSVLPGCTSGTSIAVARCSPGNQRSA